MVLVVRPMLAMSRDTAKREGPLCGPQGVQELDKVVQADETGTDRRTKSKVSGPLSKVCSEACETGPHAREQPFLHPPLKP